MGPRKYEFALIVDGVDELTPAVEDALFEAGCDDAVVGMFDGRLRIEFARDAMSRESAVEQAVTQVRAAGLSHKTISTP